MNNVPTITVPRPSDFIRVDQNNEVQLATAATQQSLTPITVTDVDSDECTGKITMLLEVSRSDARRG